MNGDHLQEDFLAMLWLSARWAVVIGVLWVGLALTKPRRIETRLLVCQLGLVGGLLIAMVPVFWGPERETESPPLTSATGENPPTESAADRLVQSGDLHRTSAELGSVQPGQVNLAANELFVAERRLASNQSEAITLAAQSPSLVGPDAATPTSQGNAFTRATLLKATCRVLMIGWLFGVLLAGLRLVTGWIWLLRLRRTAHSASEAAMSLRDQCRSELGVKRGVGLLVHSHMTSPILIGQVRPAIILPAGWDTQPLTTQKAALVHELTHLSNHDQWAKLVDELVRAVFFFHLPVRWLLNSLEGCREERCDAAVVKQGISSRELAQVLFDFAKGGAGPCRTSRLASFFFDHSTIKDRINHLLEKDFMDSTKSLSRGGRFSLALAVLGFVACIGGFGLRSSAAQAEPGNRREQSVASDQTESKSAQLKPAPLCTGKVVDDEGHPVAGAHVLLYRVMGSAKPALTQSDALGNFTIESLPGDRFNGFVLWLVAAKTGFAPVIQYVSNKPVLTLKLTKAATVTGELLDDNARPIPNGRVLFGILEKIGSSATWGYVDETAIAGTPIEPFFVGRSDAAGKFKITSAPDRAKLIFRASAPGCAELDTAASWPIKPYLTNSNTPIVLTLEPEGRIKGNITAKMPGMSLAGLTVFASPSSGSGSLYKRTTTDLDGHFEFVGLKEDAFDIWLDLPDPMSAAFHAQIGLEVEPGKTAQAELQIVPGTVVEGNVVVATSGVPVGDARITIRSSQFPRRATSLREISCDKNGRYTVRLPAGKFEFRVRWAGKGFTPVPGYEPKVVTVVDGQAAMAGPSFQVVTTPPPLVGPIDDSRDNRSASLEFEPGIKWQQATNKLENPVRIAGRVLDPDGNVVDGATVAPAATGTGNSLTGDTQYSVLSKADGSFVMLLPPSGKKKYNLVVHDGKYEEWRKWANGVLPPFKTGAGQQFKDVTIRLTRPATVRGRVVDTNNRPVVGRKVRAIAADTLENRYYDPTTETKADGTFELCFVRAGEQYIQVGPIWYLADEAPEGTTKTVQLKEGQVLDGVVLIAGEKK